MTPPVPDLDLVLDGVRHRKWVFPAYRYSDGGAQSERWAYAVGEKPYVVTFTVLTGRYPEGYAPAAPCGGDETWHREVEAVAGTCACLFLDGASCVSDGSGINAHEWYSRAQRGGEGFVPDAAVFEHIRDLYNLWSQP